MVLGGYFATLAGMRKPYPTDLSDAEWNYIEPHLPLPKGHGRPRLHDLREILDAIFYVLKSGCQWRLLPHDFPRWPTVYHYFRKWRIDGTWERFFRECDEALSGSRSVSRVSFQAAEAYSTRCLNKSNFPRPYIERLMNLSLFTRPSVCP